MPTIKMILKTDETDQSALTALLQLVLERFKVSSFERLDMEEPTVPVKPKHYVHKTRKITKQKKSGYTALRIPGTSAAAEFLALAKANPAERVSLSAYRERLIKMGYADTTAQVMVNKLARCGFVRLEGGYAFLLKSYDPHGIDSVLRKMISEGKVVQVA